MKRFLLYYSYIVFSTATVTLSVSVKTLGAKNRHEEIVQSIMRLFCIGINGPAVRNSVRKNSHHKNKPQVLFTVTFAMIACAVTKLGRVLSFSTNAKSKISRLPTRLIPKNCLFLNTSPTVSIKESHNRGLFMSAIEEDEELAGINSTWDLGGLRKEVSRLTVRCHKKTGKANERLRKAQQEVERLTGDDDVTMEELEKCPNLDEMEAQVGELRTRLTQLNELEAMLSDIKGKKTVLPERIVKLVSTLEVNDEPPQRQPRGPKKKKGPKNMSAIRLPYRRFYTMNKTEIRVSGIH